MVASRKVWNGQKEKDFAVHHQFLRRPSPWSKPCRERYLITDPDSSIHLVIRAALPTSASPFPFPFFSFPFLLSSFPFLALHVRTKLQISLSLLDSCLYTLWMFSTMNWVLVFRQGEMTLDFPSMTPAKQHLCELFALTWLAKAAEERGKDECTRPSPSFEHTALRNGHSLAKLLMLQKCCLVGTGCFARSNENPPA